MQFALFPSPFKQETFYPIPLAWLTDVQGPSGLDVYEALLYHTDDGDVIFDQQRPESWLYRDDEEAGLRAFFSRQTYSTYKTGLIRSGRMQAFQRPAFVRTRTQRAQRELVAGIKYQWTRWPPPGPILYRLRPYLERHWPAWLGNADLGSRMALLAFFAPPEHGPTPTNAPLQTNPRRTWTAIHDFVRRQFFHLGDPSFLRQKLRKGLNELELLGIVYADGPQASSYVLDLAVLRSRPVWPQAPLAQACRLDPQQDALQLALIRETMLTCAEPVTRLGSLWNAINQDYRPYLLDEVDWLALRKHVRSQRPSTLISHKRLLQEHMKRLQRSGKRILGEAFRLTAQGLDGASHTLSGNPIRMPMASAHFIAATQLFVRCEFAEGEMTTEEIIQTLRHMTLIVWQENEGGEPTISPLNSPAPKPLGVELGYIIPANQLHTHLDYRRPFEVLLKCSQPDPRLHLRCQFRLIEVGGEKARNTHEARKQRP